MVLMPLLIVVAGWFQVEAEIWRHLSETVLPELVHNTVVLLLGVGIGVFFLGTSLAWLVTAYEFPGRKAFEWLLMLPLAMPAYVLAFVLISLLDFAGPVQSVLRGLTDDLSWFPQIRSPGGVILVMSLALYPYVYLLARSAFLSQGRNALEAGRVLGLGPMASFFRVALPMARPAVVAGVAGEGEVDEPLGLGPGDQHAGTHGQLQTVELCIPGSYCLSFCGGVERKRERAVYAPNQ